MRRSLAIVVCLSLVAGCAETPKPSDPLAGQTASSPYKNLKLAIIFSENTKHTIEYGNYWAKNARTVGGAVFTMDQVTGPLVDMLKADFKDVVRAEKLADAQAAGADVIGVLDMRAPKFRLDWRWAPMLATLVTLPVVMVVNPRRIYLDEGFVFLDPQGRPIDSARTSFMSLRHWGPSFERSGEALLDAYAQIHYDFRAAYRASEPLKAYAEAKAKGEDYFAGAAVRSAVDEPGYLKPVDDKLVAVVIGGKAPYAEHDAAAVHDHLLALGYPQRNVAFVAGERASRAALEKYVESWLPERVHDGSKVLFYFAGNGAPDPVSGEAYLLPSDGDPKFLASTGYPVKRLYDKLGELKASQVVVALDAGFSGTGGRSLLAKGIRPLVNQTEAPAPAKLVVLEAASPAETAGVDEAQGHGLMTYYLLDYLKRHKGAGTVSSAYQELSPKVADAARAAGRDQKPVLLGGGSADWR